MASSKPSYVNATKALQLIRNFLAGKTLQIPVRHALSQSPRSIPAPTLPSGEAHKLAANYYYTRDGRRAACPPVKVTSHSMLESGDAEKASTTGSAVTPGEVYIPRP